MSITPNLDKFAQGFAETVMQFDRPQMKVQKTRMPNMQPSMFSNRHSQEDRSYGLEINDWVFGWLPSPPVRNTNVGRLARYAKAMPARPSMQSSLTGLQTIPGGGASKGIAEMMADSNIDEDMMRRSLLAQTQVYGVSKLDSDNEMQSRQKTSDITVQICGIVSMHAHEKMWTGGYVRVEVPSSTEYNSPQWDRGRGRALGKISLVPVMVTPRDVTLYSQTIMRNFIYNDGMNALRMFRNSPSHNLVANYSEAQMEHAVTCGIMFLYTMAERGFVSPVLRTVPEMDALPEGRSIGLFNNEEGENVFGRGNQGNHGRVFFKKELAGDGYAAKPSVLYPAEMAVFFGRMTGLLQDRDEGGSIVPGGDVEYLRAIQHADYVARSNNYEADREAFDEAMKRFYKMMFAPHGEIARSSGGRSQRTEEFGMNIFARGRPHIAREHVTANGVADIDCPKDNLYGRMLMQQRHSTDHLVSVTEDLYNENMRTIQGRVTQGGEKGKKFHFYLS